MTKFSDLALDPRVLQAVAEAGYETPTPIQAQAIPHALQGKDVLGIAQTGTGKTASFSLPMITLLGQGRARARMPRSLVLCPTRELAAQVAENFDTYAKHTKLTKALLIGGVSFGEQDRLIDRGVDVLIATPGRLLDHFERGKLLLNGVQIMVVDEADRMLDMGFIPDIERIFSLTPFTRQTLFYSATMAPEIERITNTFLQGAVKIEVARQATASETIEQRLIRLTPPRKDANFAAKRAALRALVRAEGEACTNAIIFCNRKADVDVVAKSLKSHGFNAAAIHGDLDQSQRTRTLDGFRDGSLHLLVASDVAARGLDIPAVSHVFNFDVPSHPEDYVHRIGRTGRAGRLGKAITLAVPPDEKYIAAIESLVKKTIPAGEMPEGYSFDERSGGRSEGRSEGRSSARNTPRSGSARRDSEPRSGGAAGRSHKVKLDTPMGEDAAPEARTMAATPAPESAPRQDASRAPHHHGPRDNQSRRDTPRGPRPSGGEGGSGGGGHRVLGLGDHVPDFILRSFKLAAEPLETSAAAESDGAEAQDEEASN